MFNIHCVKGYDITVKGSDVSVKLQETYMFKSPKSFTIFSGS